MKWFAGLVGFALLSILALGSRNSGPPTGFEELRSEVLKLRQVNDRMAITIHELTRWMDDELRWRRSIASVSKAWESDQWESQPAPSELLRGNFESALLSLDDARQVAQSSREASKALMALDRAEQSVMKARLALWEQESGKGK